MFRLLKFLFTGVWHMHTWQVLNKVAMTRRRAGSNLQQDYVRYTLQCKHCGEIKEQEIG